MPLFLVQALLVVVALVGVSWALHTVLRDAIALRVAEWHIRRGRRRAELEQDTLSPGRGLLVLLCIELLTLLGLLVPVEAIHAAWWVGIPLLAVLLVGALALHVMQERRTLKYALWVGSAVVGRIVSAEGLFPVAGVLSCALAVWAIHASPKAAQRAFESLEWMSPRTYVGMLLSVPFWFLGDGYWVLRYALGERLRASPLVFRRSFQSPLAVPLLVHVIAPECATRTRVVALAAPTQNQSHLISSASPGTPMISMQTAGADTWQRSVDVELSRAVGVVIDATLTTPGLSWELARAQSLLDSGYPARKLLLVVGSGEVPVLPTVRRVTVAGHRELTPADQQRVRQAVAVWLHEDLGFDRVRSPAQALVRLGGCSVALAFGLLQVGVGGLVLMWAFLSPGGG